MATAWRLPRRSPTKRGPRANPRCVRWPRALDGPYRPAWCREKATKLLNGPGPARPRCAPCGGNLKAEHDPGGQGSTLLPGPARARVAQATSSTNNMTVATTCGHALAARPRARRATTPASTTSHTQGSMSLPSTKRSPLCGHARPLVDEVGPHGIYRARATCGDMRSREEERGARAAPCAATGARATRGGPWATLFDQSCDARVRQWGPRCGPTVLTDSTTLEPRTVWVSETMLCVKKELINT